MWEILILLVVLMMLFGTSRLPQMGRSLGRGLREFKDSIGVTGREIREGIAEPVAELQGRISLEPADAEEMPAQQATTEVAPLPGTPPARPVVPAEAPPAVALSAEASSAEPAPPADAPPAEAPPAEPPLPADQPKSGPP